MRSYRIVIEYTDASKYPRDNPSNWDWHELVAMDSDEAVSLVSVEDIQTPEGHTEDLQNV